MQALQALSSQLPRLSAKVLTFAILAVLTTSLLLWKTPYNGPVMLGTATTSSLQPASPGDRKYLLLATSGRSGSSFTSALLSVHKDVFFWFEPLYPIEEKLAKNITNCPYRYEDEAKSREILESYFECRVPLDTDNLLSIQLINSPHTKTLLACLKSMKTGKEHINCYNAAMRQCKERSWKFIKTIRFPLTFADYYLEKYPGFKLIFLVRDPRAVIYSFATVFKHFNFTSPAQVSSAAKFFCKNMAIDLKHLVDLVKRYPDRVLAIRYEDGAQSPMEYAETIYKFVGIPFTDEIRKSVTTFTHYQKPQKGNIDYSVFRKNSTEAMNRWRKGAGFSGVEAVDKACSELYPILGYRKISSALDLISGQSVVNKPLGSLFYNEAQPGFFTNKDHSPGVKNGR